MSEAVDAVLREMLEEVWDDGNCTGLDGWIGPGRGSAEIDSDALHARERVIRKAEAALAAAGYGKLGLEAGIWTMTDAEFKKELAAERAQGVVEGMATVANAVRSPLIDVVNALEFTALGGRDGG